jgi:hypothetical protein
VDLRPVDSEFQVVPEASQFVFWVPVMGDGVEMDRVLMKGKAVGNPSGNYKERRLASSDKDRCRKFVSRRLFTQILDSNGRGSVHQDEVVRMNNVDVYTSNCSRVRSHGIPLYRQTLRKPRGPKYFGEFSARVSVYIQGADFNADR